ncbi:MAG: anthranilate synthase component I family protein [Proteobacteria bacterium]|nr:anthranilate synthase component I family protein [Pseudomonadota bacterium]
MNNKLEIIELKSNGCRPVDFLTTLNPKYDYIIWEQNQNKQKSESSSSYLQARYSHLIIRPKRVINFQNNILKITEGEKTKTLSVNDAALDILRKLSKQNKTSALRSEFSEDIFCGGFLGFISYDYIRYLENISAIKKNNLPDFYFLQTEAVLLFDNLAEKIFIISDNPQELNYLKNLSIKVIEKKQKLSLRTSNSTLKFGKKFNREEWVKTVERAKEYIRAGDVFQVVLANTYTAQAKINPLYFFQQLKEINPSPYHFLIKFSNNFYVGASPEKFLKGSSLSDGSKKIEMKLIAGTYPADLNPNSLKCLVNDHKELAEHLMLVDHERNDIGKVSEIGKVKVEELFAIESYSTLNHIVSEVSGILKQEHDYIDAIEACFPIATLVGTPKVRALEIIAELEKTNRGIFGGSIISLGEEGSMNSTVAIRSALITANNITIHAGAGIVYDSNPEREYEECAWKAESLFRAASTSLI